MLRIDGAAGMHCSGSTSQPDADSDPGTDSDADCVRYPERRSTGHLSDRGIEQASGEHRGAVGGRAALRMPPHTAHFPARCFDLDEFRRTVEPMPGSGWIPNRARTAGLQVSEQIPPVVAITSACVNVAVGPQPPHRICTICDSPRLFRGARNPRDTDGIDVAPMTHHSCVFSSKYLQNALAS